MGHLRKLFPILALFLISAAPTRQVDYQPLSVILDTEVESNEDVIFRYLQNGVDVIADGAVDSDAIQDDSITSADIKDGTITTADLAFSITQGNILPAGAIFFMFTGACPSWTSDVSATYSNLFLRVNSTGLTTGGVDTHTHTAGSLAGASHTHSVPYTGWTTTSKAGDQTSLSTGKTSETFAIANANNTSGSGGSGSISGTSASGNNVPAFVTARLCQVN